LEECAMLKLFGQKKRPTPLNSDQVLSVLESNLSLDMQKMYILSCFESEEKFLLLCQAMNTWSMNSLSEGLKHPNNDSLQSSLKIQQTLKLIKSTATDSIFNFYEHFGHLEQPYSNNETSNTHGHN
jgi:hypothetical protein